ncbi:hypothetical protein QBC35DRAFT_496170 [Podospora australis]|uniref:Uncharacterized protein n=1 Tax=Podospora australis TaxID=1536484 RepID=A0AAN7AJ41_9PEZI|nr:hypothetical protein QBC35DRAFT_496170 [Podospora australis]
MDMEIDYGEPATRSYEADVERTIRELKKRKNELEEALNQLSASSSSRTCVPDSELTAKDTLEIMAKAYQTVAESEPYLPTPGSILPALLAMRSTQKTIEESTEYLDSQASTLEQVERKVEVQRGELREQQALREALEKRVKSLRAGLENRQEKTQDQLARERIAELKQEKKQWDQQTSSLMKELDWFIQEHLGPMLAAEELGGPVVGQLTDIDPYDLSAGFSAQGKLKKAKDQPDIDKRQRRIDDIWGPQDQDGQPSGKRKRERDETSAATEEMRNLTEKLMNKLVEAGGDTSAAYVKISRESAAVRFLVRSKVAVFHPKDAQRLRLVDFGRDLDD